jgi:hypothetical protein
MTYPVINQDIDHFAHRHIETRESGVKQDFLSLARHSGKVIMQTELFSIYSHRNSLHNQSLNKEQ